MKPWIELHLKTSKSFEFEFHDETLMFTILTRVYKYKLIDKFELRSFPEKINKKWYLSFSSNLTIHPKCKSGSTFLWNFDFIYFLLTEFEARTFSEVWLLTKFFFCDRNVALWTTLYKSQFESFSWLKSLFSFFCNNEPGKHLSKTKSDKKWTP